VLHADLGYGIPRRVPQMLVRGPYNSWGYDQGVPANMEHQNDGTWELEVRHETSLRYSLIHFC